MAISYIQYNDPIRIVWRSGKIGDEYVNKSETQKIINNIIFLDEIPDPFTHVAITGYVEIYSGTPTSTQYIVNYQNGRITFKSTEEAKAVSATYKGRGYILYPAARIYLHNENPDIVESLQDVYDRAAAILDSLVNYGEQIMTWEFTQSTGATTWTIAHNLGKFPSATIVDNNGNVCIGEILYTSNNVITLTFTTAFSGKAYLN